MNLGLRTIGLFAAVVGILLVGCRKDDDENNTAGKGGPSALRIQVKHHNATVDSGMLYIKYNTLSRPSNSQYDDSTVILKESTGLPALAVFPNMKKGNYYLYMKGWDRYFIPGAFTFVEGERSYTLNVETPTVEITMQVSE